MVQESTICMLAYNQCNIRRRWLLAYDQNNKKHDEVMALRHSLPPMSKEAEELKQAERKWTDFFYKHYLEWRLVGDRIDVAWYELREVRDELRETRYELLEASHSATQRMFSHCEQALIELHEKLDKLVDELANYKW